MGCAGLAVFATNMAEPAAFASQDSAIAMQPGRPRPVQSSHNESGAKFDPCHRDVWPGSGRIQLPAMQCAVIGGFQISVTDRHSHSVCVLWRGGERDY
jgi:hypothetical protein